MEDLFVESLRSLLKQSPYVVLLALMLVALFRRWSKHQDDKQQAQQTTNQATNLALFETLRQTIAVNREECARREDQATAREQDMAARLRRVEDENRTERGQMLTNALVTIQHSGEALVRFSETFKRQDERESALVRALVDLNKKDPPA